MAKRKFRPQQGKHQPVPQQVQVDLSQAETMKCEYCGNYVFIKGTVLKRLSPLVSPTGQEAIVPIEIYSCGSCGEENIRKLVWNHNCIESCALGKRV